MKSMARLGSVLFCLIVSTLLWLSSVNPAWALTFPNLLALSKPTDPLALHFVNRLSFGPRPGDLEHIQAIGVEDYIQEQLNSDNRLNPIDLEQKLNRLPNFNLTPIALLQNYLPKSPPKTRSPQEQSQFTKQLRSVLQETITAHFGLIISILMVLKGGINFLQLPTKISLYVQMFLGIFESY
jgi:hypothetical protein